MNGPVGLSILYPGVPIGCVLSMVALLILVPGFWKTRVWALLAIVFWIFLGNLLKVIGILGWRGSIHNSPIWADLFVALGYIQPFGAYTAMVCFSRFLWQRSRHLSARQILDNRRRDNLIDGFLTVVLPVLWLPTSRYYIIEDFGPQGSGWIDWVGFVMVVAPACLFALVMGTFYALALLNYWRLKREGQDSNFREKNTSLHIQKLLWFSLTSLLLTGFMIGWTIGIFLHYFPVSTWGDPNMVHTPAQNIKYLKIVIYVNRSILDTKGANPITTAAISQSMFAIFLGFYMFAWFGLGAEARKSYQDAFTYFIRLFGVRPDAQDTRPLRLTKVSSNRLPIAGIISPFPPLSNPEISHLPSSEASTLNIERKEGRLSSRVLDAPPLPLTLVDYKGDASPYGRPLRPRVIYEKQPFLLTSMDSFARKNGALEDVRLTSRPLPPIPAPAPAPALSHTT